MYRCKANRSQAERDTMTHEEILKIAGFTLKSTSPRRDIWEKGNVIVGEWQVQRTAGFADVQEQWVIRYKLNDHEWSILLMGSVPIEVFSVAVSRD